MARQSEVGANLIGLFHDLSVSKDSGSGAHSPLPTDYICDPPCMEMARTKRIRRSSISQLQNLVRQDRVDQTLLDIKEDIVFISKLIEIIEEQHRELELHWNEICRIHV